MSFSYFTDYIMYDNLTDADHKKSIDTSNQVIKKKSPTAATPPKVETDKNK